MAQPPTRLSGAPPSQGPCLGRSRLHQGPLLSTRFIDFAVAKFLHEEDPTIRCAAALCCCNALSRVVGRADAASLSLRNHILERCLVLGATDLDVDLRTRHAPPDPGP